MKKGKTAGKGPLKVTRCRLTHVQCDQIWRHFTIGQIIQSIWQSWQNFEPTEALRCFGPIIFVVIGQILNLLRLKNVLGKFSLLEMAKY